MFPFMSRLKLYLEQSFSRYFFINGDMLVFIRRLRVPCQIVWFRKLQNDFSSFGWQRPKMSRALFPVASSPFVIACQPVKLELIWKTIQFKTFRLIETEIQLMESLNFGIFGNFKTKIGNFKIKIVQNFQTRNWSRPGTGRYLKCYWILPVLLIFWN